MATTFRCSADEPATLVVEERKEGMKRSSKPKRPWRQNYAASRPLLSSVETRGSVSPWLPFLKTKWPPLISTVPLIKLNSFFPIYCGYPWKLIIWNHLCIIHIPFRNNFQARYLLVHQIMLISLVCTGWNIYIYIGNPFFFSYLAQIL